MRYYFGPRRRRYPRRHFFKWLFLTGCLIIFGGQYLIGEMAEMTVRQRKVVPILSPARQQHILHGDKSGGGHLHGAGKACKSEFPADWSADDILTTIRQEAANDNLAWQRQGNGNIVAETRQRDVTVRIVLSPDRREIITAYPTDTERNPCPAANDNAAE
jgi:hypothetical protein